MADTRKTLSALQTALANNTTEAITPQDLRDFLVSTAPPYGAMYVSTPVETVIATQNTWTKTLGTTTSTNLKEFSMPSAGRLTYTGAPDVHVHVALTISFTATGSNETFGWRVVKNGDETGTDSVASETRRKVGSGSDVGSTALHYDGMMSNGDYLELWVENETSAGDVEVENLYFFAMGMLA